MYVNSDCDPTFRHIGINIGSKTSSNVTKFEGTIGQRVTARINYEAETKVISVHATSAAEKFDVSFVYDLGALLPEKVQVGLVGSTGLYVAVHDVVSWYFSSTLLHDHMNEFEGAKIIQL